MCQILSLLINDRTLTLCCIKEMNFNFKNYLHRMVKIIVLKLWLLCGRQ